MEHPSLSTLIVRRLFSLQQSQSSHALTKVPVESVRMHVPEPPPSSSGSNGLSAESLELSSVSRTVMSEDVSSKFVSSVVNLQYT